MDLDLSIFLKLNDLAGQNRILDGIAIFFAKYAPFIFVFIILLYLLKEFRENEWLILKILLAGIFARFVVAEIIRLFYFRQRPFVELAVNQILPHEASGSFPSGHAVFFFAISTILLIWNKKIGLLSFMITFLMGIARVFGGAHWLSDIIAGFGIGIISALIVEEIVNRFTKKTISSLK
jgi:undecaprenyl-diphosphatase